MKNFLTYIILILILFILVNCDKGDDAVPKFTATVNGTVVNEKDVNERLSGVNITLFKGTEVVRSVSTNAQGNFAIEENVLLEETFSVVASLEGYFDFVADEFTLTSGNQTQELDIHLMPFSKIFGKVRNGISGKAVQEAIVTLANLDQNISSNNLGEYEFLSLNEGSYIISATKTGYKAYSSEILVGKSEFKNLDINLEPLPAVLEISTTTLDFGVAEVSRSFEIANRGGDTINWFIVENIPWATVNPSRGQTISNPSTVTITVDRNGFNPGSYAQTLTVSSDNSGAKEINLTMTINGALLQIIPSELSFGTNSNEESLQLTRIGQGTLNYEIQADKSWATVEPSSGTVMNETDFVIVKLDRSGLDFGNYEVKLAFNSDNDSQIVIANLTVPDPNAPQLTVDPSILNLGQGVANKILTIENTGEGNLTWNVSKSTTWLTMSKSEGELVSDEAENIRITIDRSALTPGEYDDILRFTSNGGNLNVPVNIEVANIPVLSVSTDNLNFGRSETSKSFQISNIGNGTMTWSVSTNQEWIGINPISGTNTGTINVSVLRDELSNGNYSGQIDIESDGGVSSVLVEMDILPPNEPPIADFTISKEVANLEQEITLDASASSDAEDALSLLEVRWKYETSGSFTEWVSSKQSAIAYETQGIKKISLEVRDTEGDISSITKEVNVIENQPPNAVFSVNPGSGKISVTEFKVDATGSRDDIDKVEDLQYRWKWEDGQNFTAWSLTKTAVHIYGRVGTKTITLEVLDSFGKIGSTTNNVELTEDLNETEPNDLFTTANELPIDTELTGEIGFSEDIEDWFKLVAPTNGTVRFFIKNTGSGSNANLGVLEILNSDLHSYLL